MHIKASMDRDPLATTLAKKWGILKDERKEVIAECGPMAFLVYEFLVEMCSWKNPPIKITDELIAEHFGLAPSSIKRHRQRLIRFGYLYTSSITDYKKQQSWRSHHVGKAAVTKARAINNSPFKAPGAAGAE